MERIPLWWMLAQQSSKNINRGSSEGHSNPTKCVSYGQTLRIPVVTENTR